MDGTRQFAERNYVSSKEGKLNPNSKIHRTSVKKDKNDPTPGSTGKKGNSPKELTKNIRG